MGRGTALAAGIAIGVAILARSPATGAAQPAPAPTFNQQVAPILFARCASCHRPGDIGPMSLLSYEAARPWATPIKARVTAREMPPWPADPRYGQFRNAHVLTDTEIAVLAAWADAGAPQGDGVPPAPPAFLDGWTSQMDRPPDMVIEAPVRVDVPPTGIVPEFTVWAKLPFGKERFVEAIELRPLDRSVVHHASVFRARLPRGVSIGRAEAWPGGPVLDGIPVMRDGSPARLPSNSVGQPLVFYVPSGGFLRFPKGAGKRIPGNEHLKWTFHLMPHGHAAQGSARVGLWFSRDRVENEIVTWTVTDTVFVNGKEVPRDAGGPRMPNIAPRDANYTVTGLMRVTRPLTLYALWPHMHNRGRDITFVLDAGGGREQVLLSVPRYRFAWQFTYELATPLRIAAGSTIKAIAHYDNSARNPENPAPDQEVTWGPQAFNEMFDPFVEIAYDKSFVPSLPGCGPGGLQNPNGPGQSGGFLGGCP